MERVLLWGTGDAYVSCADKVNAMADKFNLEIVGVTSMSIIRERINDYGHREIPLTEVDSSITDYILMMVWAPRHIREIRPLAQDKGFASSQIVSVINIVYGRWNWKQGLKSRGEIPQYKGSRFSIFSMNCSGGFLSHSMHMKFYSPFINMWILEDDWLKFLKEPHSYVDTPLVFSHREEKNPNVPVFVWDDITVTMSPMSRYCDKDPKLAIQKWNERTKRIIWEHIFVIAFTENPSFLAKFAKLPYEHKVCFVPFQSAIKSAYTVDKSQWDDRTLGWISCRIAQGEVPSCYGKLLEYLP